MNDICSHCQYERKDTDTAPIYLCPFCGVVYEQYEAEFEEAKRIFEARSANKEQPKKTNSTQQESVNVRKDWFNWCIYGISAFFLLAVGVNKWNYDHSPEQIKYKKVQEMLQDLLDEQKARKAKLASLAASTKTGEQVQELIRKNLNDPFSVRFNEISINEYDDLACVEWNAKNSLGGYVGWRVALLMKLNGTWKISELEARDYTPLPGYTYTPSRLITDCSQVESKGDMSYNDVIIKQKDF